MLNIFLIVGKPICEFYKKKWVGFHANVCIFAMFFKMKNMVTEVIDTSVNNAALVLFSGGQDSTVCLFWALKRFDRVETICFRYGQRHVSEIEAAQTIAAIAGVSFRIIDASMIAGLSNNSLTDASVPMDREQTGTSPPNTFVPGRNLLFISMAAVVARERNIAHLITGVSQADYSGYPDCRDTFIRSLNVTLNHSMDEQFVIHTPLMQHDKAAVWKLADELRIFELVKTRTVTCYNGIPGSGCGECPSCQLRSKGLQQYRINYGKNTDKLWDNKGNDTDILLNNNDINIDDLIDNNGNTTNNLQIIYGKNLRKNSIQILLFLESDPYITAAVMAEKLGVSASTVEKCLSAMKTNNIIQRVGHNRGGYWKILILNS